VDDSYWDAVADTRLRLADLLDDISPAEWEAPSLCAGWRVRDVAGHVSIIPTVTTGQLLAAGPRGRFNPNRINTVLAVRNGCRPTGEIVAAIRRHARERRTARMLDTRDSLFDVVVHSQDIALPLEREFAVRPDHARRGLERVWEMGWPFKAGKRFTGLTLRATDIEWRVGAGPEITGTALSLLLLLTGREGSVVPALSGDGMAVLNRRKA
jgi:uncharacterized protein (TIGR03083 family)